MVRELEPSSSLVAVGTIEMPRGPKGQKRPADVIGNAYSPVIVQYFDFT